MALIEWDDSLKLRISSIDTQHQRLVGLINHLDEAIKAGQGYQQLGEVLEELLDYTRTHFAYEEALLQKHGYPAYSGHKAEHDALTEKVFFLAGMFKEGDRSLDSDQILAFLEVWVREHILEVDRAYAEFLKQRGVN